MKIRVLLADDHQIVIEGLKALLRAEADMELVGEAHDGRAAVDLAAQLSPDVVVLDVTMPELNGIAAIHEIRKVAPEAEILGLSMHAAKQVVCDMLQAGAAGYMLKTASVQDLAAAIRTVMTGQTYLSAEVVGLIPDHLLRSNSDRRRTASAAPAEPAALTEREREVLKLVAEGRSSKEIAAALFVTTKTIVWHRQGIMDKLNLRSVAELTKYAIRMGLTSLNS